MSFCGLSKSVTAIIAGTFTLCGAEELAVTTENGTSTISWPTNGSAVAGRTYGWIISYLVISIIWAISALLFLIGSVSNAKGVTGVQLRLPWQVITAVLLILDVIASVIYYLDISYTEDLEQLLLFVGLEVPDEILSATFTTSIFGAFTMGPSIIAALFVSRAVVIWVLNLTLLIHVGQDSRQNEEAKTTVDPRKSHLQFMRKMSTIGPIPDEKWDPYQRKRSEVTIVKPLRVPSPPNERKRKQSDYGQYLHFARYLPQVRLNETPSESSGAELRSPATDAPPAELRGQLPWSYFQDRDSISAPKPVSGESRPPVPVPDYTLHFPKKHRSPIGTLNNTKEAAKPSSSGTKDSPSSSASSENWQGPEVLY